VPGMPRRITPILLTIVVAGASAPMRADAGELVHFRLPDGSVGLVDDPSKVPPGAVIETRPAAASPTVSPTPKAATGYKLPQPHDGYWSDGVEAARGLSDRCRRFELPPGCSEDEVSWAGSWAARAEKLRTEIKQAEEHVDWYQRSYDECDRSAARVCSTRQVDHAKEELAARESALDALEEECKREGCLPGWLR
jgi:hypothetical protein